MYYAYAIIYVVFVSVRAAYMKGTWSDLELNKSSRKKSEWGFMINIQCTGCVPFILL